LQTALIIAGLETENEKRMLLNENPMGECLRQPFSTTIVRLSCRGRIRKVAKNWHRKLGRPDWTASDSIEINGIWKRESAFLSAQADPLSAPRDSGTVMIFIFSDVMISTAKNAE
jgi:hypothetical protein